MPVDPAQAPTTLDAFIHWLTERYESANLWYGHGTTSAEEEAAWTVSAVLDIELDVILDDDVAATHPITSEQASRVAAVASERIDSRKPLAYLINEAWFGGERFFVDERAIVPRSHLGEWIPDRFEPWINPTGVNRIIDIGTGSGCIAIALALAFPEATVDATDISETALEVAAINIREFGLADRITLTQCDLYPDSTSSWDLIVTNPPYVDDITMSDLPGEYHHEPDIAFRGGADGLDIVERLIDGAKTRINDNGYFIIEAGTARVAMEVAWPDASPIWLSTESGEDGIALIEKSALLTMERKG